MSSKENKPLEGINVVAVEQAVAAPLTSSRLADAGAHVVKFERPEGDFARGYDDVAAGMSSYFVWLNRGKKTRIADLRTDEGKALLDKAIDTADILIQNLKPGSFKTLGYDISKLREKYPKLIICSISGFGEEGPLAHRKSYDLLVQAETGLSSITGGPQEAARVGFSVADIATGQTAYAAILEALIKRSVTGKGADISVSLFDTMAEWLTVPLLNHEGGNTPQRVGLAHPSIAPYGVFTTKDGIEILISIQSDREWRKLCAEFIGDETLGTHKNFETNVARAKNRTQTDSVVGAAFASRTAQKAIDILEHSSIAFACVNDMAALSTHPHLRRITVETPNGPVSYPAPAPIFKGEPREYGPVSSLPKREET